MEYRYWRYIINKKNTNTKRNNIILALPNTKRDAEQKLILKTLSKWIEKKIKMDNGKY